MSSHLSNPSPRSGIARTNSNQRFNEPTRGMVPRGPALPGQTKTAFGAKAPSARGAARPKPPLMPRPVVEGFDKKEWIREYKMLKKDIDIDERDRYRPLMCIKRELSEFILECEKTEKKDQINLRREEDQQLAFVERQKQDVRAIKTMVGDKAAKTSDVDKIHQKV